MGGGLGGIPIIGDLFGGGGGNDVNVSVPGPSPEERALQAEQVEILRQQRDLAEQQAALTSALLPATLESAGMRAVFDDTGRITGVEKIELTPEEQEREDLRKQIEQGFLERTEAALAGELPVSPALLTELEEQESALRERLRKEGLQPGDTPFEQAMGQFVQREQNILEGARRADLTLAEQLGLARESANLGREQTALANLFAQPTVLNPAAAALGAAGTAFNPTLSRLQRERFGPAEMDLRAQIANLQFAEEDPFGAILGGFGGAFAGGAGAALAAGMFCWVAREVFGPRNPEWVYFRDWLLTEAPRWFVRLYAVHGRTFAAWVRGRYWVKVFLKPVMSYVATRHIRKVLSHAKA